jgi:NAD(P)-dependent dehydrogenase (short-subunit alcohol dehydrogenase family)
MTTSPSNTLTGQACLVTGATGGIGLETARALAKRGATVIAHGRNEARSQAAVADIQASTGNEHVAPLVADLSDLAQVRRMAADLKARYPRLDLLVNNAGAFYMRRQESADGYELTLAVNYLSHFLLTNLLLDTLRASAPARIVNVTSGIHHGGKIQWDDLQMERRYAGQRAYAQAKLAVVMFTQELARRLAGEGVTANAVHPGWVATGIGMGHGLFSKALTAVMARFALSPVEGAATSLYVATSPELEGVTGGYYANEASEEPSPASRDRAQAERLWVVSSQLVGLAPRA